MPNLYREYLVWEAAICLRSHLDRSNISVKEGDIVDVRRPTGFIGKLEAHIYLWLLFEGLERREMQSLSYPIYENYDYPPENPDLRGNIVVRCRYCIPLERLKKIKPTFDIDLARNRNAIYQPYLPIETDNVFHRIGTTKRVEKEKNGLLRLPSYCIKEPPFNVHGLVFDKRFQRYL